MVIENRQIKSSFLPEQHSHFFAVSAPGTSELCLVPFQETLYIPAGLKAREQPLHLDPLSGHRSFTLQRLPWFVPLKTTSHSQGCRQNSPNPKVQPARLLFIISVWKEAAPGLHSSHQENYVCYTGFVQGKGIFLLTHV